jgi:type IV secretory pathway TrbL component
VAWVGDITYIPTGAGWLYLASVRDLGSRRLLGSSMADHMRTELVATPSMGCGAQGGASAGTSSTGTGAARVESGGRRNTSPSAMAQPTTRREDRSMTLVRYSQPSQVQM